MKRMSAGLLVALQYLLPRHALTRAVHALARVRVPAVKNALIRGFVRVFRVDTGEVDGRVPDDFATFNDFFIRELRPGSRPLQGGANVLVSPADGAVSAAGAIERGRLFQAKGRDYALDDLLATDLADADGFEGGRFISLYLAPHNYHRVHAPLAGRLTAMRYVPGDLFSVNAATVARIPRLFARNERLVCHLTTDCGPVRVLLVGALNVGSIGTPWTGEIRPRRRGVVEAIDPAAGTADTALARGDLLGWFNMGSTVIVLLPRGACELNDDLAPEYTVRVGEALGRLHGPAP